MAGGGSSEFRELRERVAVLEVVANGQRHRLDRLESGLDAVWKRIEKLEKAAKRRAKKKGKPK